MRQGSRPSCRCRCNRPAICRRRIRSGRRERRPAGAPSLRGLSLRSRDRNARPSFRGEDASPGMNAVTEQPALTEGPGSLASRVAQVPPLADTRRAQDKLADLVGRAEEAPGSRALLPYLERGAFRDLVLALADHSPFLWQLALAEPARLARLAVSAPEHIARELVGHVADLFRSPGLTQQEAAREFRRARALHALLVALADVGGVWTVDEVTR